MDLHDWLLFLTACTVLNATPGPDNLYITSRTIAQGHVCGLLSALGVCTGGMLHALAAGIGLSAILANSALAFGIIKWMGVAYLAYLGLMAFRQQDNTLSLEQASASSVASYWEIYLQGILVDLLNPKTALFFLAFIPQFIAPDRGPQLGQFLFLGMVLILNALLIELIIIFSAHRLTYTLRKNRHLGDRLQRVMGTLLIALSVKLAFQEA